MIVDWESFRHKLTPLPKKQFPVGSRVYKGHQGKGKTLSMVHYALSVKKQFPKCIIYSNIKLKNTPFDLTYFYFDDVAGLREAISKTNGADGVLVLLDEAHLFFNRKDGIGVDVLTAISQQRKDRRKLVFSSQIWEELDLSLRKQVKEVVDCHTFWHIEINRVSDGETLSYDKTQSEYVAKKIRLEIFKLNDENVSVYDTYQKIVSNRQYVDNNTTPLPPVVIVGKGRAK